MQYRHAALCAGRPVINHTNLMSDGLHLHHVLYFTRLSTWSMSFRFVHGQPCCWSEKHDVDLHTVMTRNIYALSSQWYAIHCSTTWTDVSHWMSANRLKLNDEKTELLWAGSRHGQTSLGSSGLSLHLRADTVVPSDEVRVLRNTKKFDRGLSHLLHTDLHWLDVPERVQFKLCMTVRRCVDDKAPRYLKEYCVSV